MRTRRRTNTGNEKEKLTIQNYSFFVIKDPDPVKSLPDPQHWTNYGTTENLTAAKINSSTIGSYSNSNGYKYELLSSKSRWLWPCSMQK